MIATNESKHCIYNVARQEHSREALLGSSQVAFAVEYHTDPAGKNRTLDKSCKKRYTARCYEATIFHPLYSITSQGGYSLANEIVCRYSTTNSVKINFREGCCQEPHSVSTPYPRLVQNCHFRSHCLEYLIHSESNRFQNCSYPKPRIVTRKEVARLEQTALDRLLK